ncbi:MAG TPA: metallophosphoesterase family protein [Thermoanaerobaculia bacterium]|nr:metallophosphoesterase family protein [Thermoanaerobaculia bacterium]
MRHLILSDIHGNADALQTVLRRVRRKRLARTLVLGDLVGYGAAPNQVIDQMRELPGELFIVRGNHDKVACGLDEGEGFNEIALISARWTAERLTRRHLDYLRRLPAGPLAVQTGGEGVEIAICHGAPDDEDLYLFAEQDAWQSFQAPPRAHLTFFGHTHLPSLFVLHQGGVRGMLLRGEGRLRISSRLRYLINPGSVGQPRDRDPSASFMIYDSQRQMLTWRRLAYPIERAQQRILDAGLPPPLAERLVYGV